MNAALGQRVGDLTNIGWTVTSQTESSASLESRKPFNFWLFLIVFILFPIFGGLLYILFWLTTSRAHLFITADGDSITESGDIGLVEHNEEEREALIARSRAIKERGFWSVMWPSIVAFILVILVWFFFIWLFVQIVD